MGVDVETGWGGGEGVGEKEGWARARASNVETEVSSLEHRLKTLPRAVFL